MSDPPLSYKVLHRPIFLLMRLALLEAKWQLAFWTELMAFFPIFFFFFVETQGKRKKKKKKGKITSISVPICCPSSDVWPCFYLIPFVHFHHCYPLWFTGMAMQRSWTSIWNGTQKTTVIISKKVLMRRNKGSFFSLMGNKTLLDKCWITALKRVSDPRDAFISSLDLCSTFMYRK